MNAEPSILFFGTPCLKRCSPNAPSLQEQHVAKVAQVCRYIENATEELGLAELARSIDMSPYHFHRVFRAVTGVTPKQYATAHRTKTVRQRLKSSKTVTEAIYDAGYNSSSRFYGSSDQILGMKPGSFKAGGNSEDIRFAVGQTSLGSILVGQSERGICAILLGDDPDALVRDLEDRFPRTNLLGGDRSFEFLMATIVGLVETPNPRPRPSTRHSGNSVPATCLASLARDSFRYPGELCRDCREDGNTALAKPCRPKRHLEHGRGG